MYMVTSRWKCIMSAEVLKVLLDIQPVDHESDLDICVGDA